MPASSGSIAFLIRGISGDVANSEETRGQKKKAGPPSLLESCHTLREDVARIIQTSREQRRLLKKVAPAKPPESAAD